MAGSHVIDNKTHIVIDSNAHFVINPDDRSISLSKTGGKTQRLTLVKGDHQSEKVTFSVPETIDGHEMNLCNVVRVHFINVDSATKQESADVYQVVEGLSADPDNSGHLAFTWLISRTATKYAGTLAFSVEFQCVINGKVEYEWHTGIFKNITVSDTLDVGEQPVEEHSDILNYWYNNLYASSTLPIVVTDMETYSSYGDTINSDNTLYVIEDETLEYVSQDDLNEVRDGLQQVKENLIGVNNTAAENSADISKIKTDVKTNFSKIQKLEDAGSSMQVEYANPSSEYNRYGGERSKKLIYRDENGGIVKTKIGSKDRGVYLLLVQFNPGALASPNIPVSLIMDTRVAPSVDSPAFYIDYSSTTDANTDGKSLGPFRVRFSYSLLGGGVFDILYTDTSDGGYTASSVVSNDNLRPHLYGYRLDFDCIDTSE